MQSNTNNRCLFNKALRVQRTIIFVDFKVFKSSLRCSAPTYISVRCTLNAFSFSLLQICRCAAPFYLELKKFLEKLNALNTTPSKKWI